MRDSESPVVECQRKSDLAHAFLCLLYSQQLHHRQQCIHLLAARNALEKTTIGWPSTEVRCDKNAEWFDNCLLSLSSAIDPASSSVRWQPASPRSPGSFDEKSFSQEEAQSFVKVLKSLSWASRRKLLFDGLQLYPKSPTLLPHFWRRYCIYEAIYKWSFYLAPFRLHMPPAESREFVIQVV